MEGVGVGEVIGDKFLSDENIFSRDVWSFPWWQLVMVVVLDHRGMIDRSHNTPVWRGDRGTMSWWPDNVTHCTGRSKQTVLCQETPLDLFVKTNSHDTLRLTSSLNKQQWTPMTVTMPSCSSQPEPDHNINNWELEGGGGNTGQPQPLRAQIFELISMSEHTIWDCVEFL